MLGSDAARAAVARTIAALAYTNVLEVWHIFIVSLLFGFVDAFFQPAYAALLPQIVPIADLCHFGVPDWLESFQNPRFPDLLARYAGDFARRFRERNFRGWQESPVRPPSSAGRAAH